MHQSKYNQNLCKFDTWTFKYFISYHKINLLFNLLTYYLLLKVSQGVNKYHYNLGNCTCTYETSTVDLEVSHLEFYLLGEPTLYN